MTACAQREFGAVVVEDVLRVGNISRGTFYTYFDSLQDAINIVADQWINESVEIFDEMYPDLEDSKLKCAIGLQLIFLRSAIQPSWGATIAQAFEYLSKSHLVRAMRADIVRAMRNGTYRRADVQAALDLNLAVMAQGVRTLCERRTRVTPYIRSVSQGVLTAMGVPAATAQETVAWATIDLKTRGPRHLDWWKDIS